jgi:hypothetical protein
MGMTMSETRVGALHTKSIGVENEGVVLRGYAARVRDGFAAARGSGSVTLVPLKSHEVTALKAQLQSGTRTHGDESVDIGGDQQLIQRDGKVYLRAGDEYSAVIGYRFPPRPMARPKNG